METLKYTEGEWKVEAKNLIKCNGEQIGSANSMLDEYEANAKLMAASKDLLEALKAMLSRFESTDLGMAKADHVRQQAINAINKTK